MYSNNYSSYKGASSSSRSLSGTSQRYHGGNIRSSSITPYTGSSYHSSGLHSTYSLSSHSPMLSALSLSSPSSPRYAPIKTYSPSSSGSSSPRLSSSLYNGHQSLASLRSMNRGSDYGSWSVSSGGKCIRKRFCCKVVNFLKKLGGRGGMKVGLSSALDAG